MCSVVKGIVRFGVVGLLAGGATAFVAETVRPGSVSAILHRAGSVAGSVIDRNIDDAAAMRAQLRSLESAFPKKIAEVRSDLAGADEQIAQLERELAVSEKVVALTGQDLSILDHNIEVARSAADRGSARIARVSFDDRPMSLDEAYAKRTDIKSTQAIYENRADEISTELSYLGQQRDQLATLLAKLEREHAELKADVFRLDAQIDSLARNERMLATMEARQQTIDEHSRYRAGSLDQLEGRLAKIREQQRGRFEAIAGQEAERGYVDEAQYLIERESALEVEQHRELPLVEPRTEEAGSLAHN